MTTICCGCLRQINEETARYSLTRKFVVCKYCWKYSAVGNYNNKNFKEVKKMTKESKTTTTILCSKCDKECLISVNRMEEMKKKKEKYVENYTCRDCKRKVREEKTAEK